MKDQRTYKIREKKWDELRKKGVKVIIATLKIASKGLNIKSLDNLINAAANGNGDDSIQALGRALRISDGKAIGTYIDFMDQGKYTKTWSRIRFRALEKEGHEIEMIPYDQNI